MGTDGLSVPQVMGEGVRALTLHLVCAICLIPETSERLING